MSNDERNTDRKRNEALIQRRSELVAEIERVATRKAALTAVLKLTDRRIEATAEQAAKESQ